MLDKGFRTFVHRYRTCVYTVAFLRGDLALIVKQQSLTRFGVKLTLRKVVPCPYGEIDSAPMNVLVNFSQHDPQF